MADTIQATILAMEEKLRDAMLRSHVPTLDELIAPDLLFTDFRGHRVTKQQDLDAHATGAIKIDAITPSEQHVLLLEKAAVVSVRVQIAGSYNGEPASGDFRFTRVWSQTPTGAWQIVAGHCGSITPA